MPLSEPGRVLIRSRPLTFYGLNIRFSRHKAEDMSDLPWGTHLCVFYHTKQDLLDMAVG
jgi:hypothetical protein